MTTEKNNNENYLDQQSQQSENKDESHSRVVDMLLKQK